METQTGSEVKVSEQYQRVLDLSKSCGIKMPMIAMDNSGTEIRVAVRDADGNITILQRPNARGHLKGSTQGQRRKLADKLERICAKDANCVGFQVHGDYVYGSAALDPILTDYFDSIEPVEKTIEHLSNSKHLDGYQERHAAALAWAQKAVGEKASPAIVMLTIPDYLDAGLQSGHKDYVQKLSGVRKDIQSGFEVVTLGEGRAAAEYMLGEVPAAIVLDGGDITANFVVVSGADSDPLVYNENLAATLATGGGRWMDKYFAKVLIEQMNGKSGQTEASLETLLNAQVVKTIKEASAGVRANFNGDYNSISAGQRKIGRLDLGCGRGIQYDITEAADSLPRQYGNLLVDDITEFVQNEQRFDRKIANPAVLNEAFRKVVLAGGLSAIPGMLEYIAGELMQRGFSTRAGDVTCVPRSDYKIAVVLGALARGIRIVQEYPDSYRPAGE